MGATIDLRATGVVLRKSGTLVLTKTVVAWLATLCAAHFIPDDGVKTGVFAGLSLLAITASMDMTNGGLYAAVMQQYGTKEEAGAFVLMSIESGPLVSMFILGATGVAVFEARLFAGAVLPFLIGFALGNLDKDLRELFGRCVHPLIPFFGFALGNGIDLTVIAKRPAGASARADRDCDHRHSADAVGQADRWRKWSRRARGVLHGRCGGGEPGNHRRDGAKAQTARARGNGYGGDGVSRHSHSRAYPDGDVGAPCPSCLGVARFHGSRRDRARAGDRTGRSDLTRLSGGEDRQSGT